MSTFIAATGYALGCWFCFVAGGVMATWLRDREEWPQERPPLDMEDVELLTWLRERYTKQGSN